MIRTNDIWKYLQQQMESDDIRKVELWIAASEANKAQFDEIKLIWEAFDHLEETRIVEDDWDEIDHLITNKDTSGKTRRIRWIAFAASFLLFTSILTWFLIPEKAPLFEEYTALSDSEILVLPDSSRVTLGKNSTVSYFTRMEDSFTERRVVVDGVATFDITSNPKLPFVVELNKTGIEVLGTIFIVEQKDSNDVTLENIEGLIKFYELANVENSVVVNEGETFSYDGEGFANETPVPEPPPPPKKNYIFSVEKAIEILSYKFKDKFSTIAFNDEFDLKSKVRLDMDKSLDDIILQLMEQAEITYSRKCEDCFELRSIKLR